MALRRHRPFLLLLLLFIVGVGAHMASLPVMEGSDEPIHFNYVAQLMAGEGLPDRATRDTNPTQQTSGQPPLAYAVTALWGRLLSLQPLDGGAVLNHIGVTVRNRWYQPHDIWARADNHNVYYHGDDDARGVREVAFSWPELVRQDRLLRLTGLLWGVLAVIGMYGAAGEVFRQGRWRLTATALFAFMPTMLHISSYVTNDTAATAFATLVTWGALRIVRRGASTKLVLLTGTALALGGLAKVNVLLLAPGVGLVLLLAPNLPPPQRNLIAWARAALWRGVLLGIPLLLFFAPWVLYGWVTYNDPFGFNTHRHLTQGFYFSEPLPLSNVIRQLPHTYLSYLGWFATVPLHPLTYTALGVGVGAAVLGLILGVARWRDTSPPDPLSTVSKSGMLREGETNPLVARSPSPNDRSTRFSVAPVLVEGDFVGGSGGEVFSGTKVRAALVLLLIFLAVFAGMVRWMQQLSFTGGRLMYPAHAAVAIGLTAGLYALAGRWPRLGRAVQVYTVTVVATAGLVLAIPAMREAYNAPQRLSVEQLPSLTGSPVDYAETPGGDPILRLLGVHFPAGNRIAGNQLPLTLCWETLATPTRLAAYSVKFIYEGEIAADRTTVFGLGRYNTALWQPGDSWCETLSMWMDDPDLIEELPLRPATLYDVVVVVLDASTLAVDFPAQVNGQAVEAPIVEQVISPAGQIAASSLNPSDIVFSNFADITGYTVEGTLTAGASLFITVAYSTIGETPDSWATFLHLYREDEFVAVLADGVPRGGAYPTWAWQTGETINDTWAMQLPTDLPSGEYAIQLGFYRPDTGERMPVLQNKQPAANTSATLFTFEVR